MTPRTNVIALQIIAIAKAKAASLSPGLQYGFLYPMTPF